ncbi:hypothetical protein [Paralysiella testudinis]|uniref:Uncharacterized protein n=1 Tax=Paralysiella testudinis TaxID=2809020 RepID=A0A892ZJT8_9NEIS|nr:hypothetical protein [Paralysiella testudinis]QRQ82893.1 hypothetical protein JQU52_05835 [Paralysiella testudinis]
MLINDREPNWAFLFGIILLIFAMVVFASLVQYQEEKQWAADAQAHNCRIIQTDNSSQFKKTTTWQCPDGSVHIR